MSKLLEETPKSFKDFITCIEKAQEKNKYLWYRGCGNSSYKLIPTLYRHKTKTSIEDLAKLEYQLLTRFRQRSIPFHNKHLDDDWDVLFFMQHYGVPTRLLDWSENPFIALYFAIMSAPFKVIKGKLEYASSASIWILDPGRWNRHALKHQSYDQGILTTSDDPIKGYKPTIHFANMNTLPVALYGAHNSPRIVAQRGVFTIFGQNKSPMDKIYVTDKFPEHCLIKVIIEDSVLPKIRESILNHGITESVVYPDLEGLAKEIRRLFEFEA